MLDTEKDYSEKPIIKKIAARRSSSFSKKFKSKNKPSLFKKDLLSNQEKIHHFLSIDDKKSGFDFVDQIFEYFNFNYLIKNDGLKNIPEYGPLIIVANQAIGSLDALSLLKAIGEIRSDIKVVADNTLMNFSALKNFLIPASSINPNSQKEITKALFDQSAVIIFPAIDHSHNNFFNFQEIGIKIKERFWSTDFIRLSQEFKAPILPVLVQTERPALFHTIAILSKLFDGKLPNKFSDNKSAGIISLIIGQPIPFNKLSNHKLSEKNLTKRIKKHVYKLEKNNNKEFITEKTLARPEKTEKIIKSLSSAITLGETRDQNTIYLADYQKKSALIKEIGRLREYTFRQVGEGTGSSRDLDSYDKHYRHLILWHKENQQIVGAYRIGEAGKLIAEHGVNGLYTASLYNFSNDIIPYLKQGLELGRSFIHPEFWGKSSLDYLWQGIGAFIRHHPEVRYVLGPVSISADYPKALTDELVFYFKKYYQTDKLLATANNPYQISHQEEQRLHTKYVTLDTKEGMEKLQESFKSEGYKIPVLFKQYTSLYEEDGIKLLAFNIDPDFGNCVDALLLGDLQKFKKKKRQRYIDAN